eukprot:tig00020934_g16119.t1
MSGRSIVVCGATGTQGGATVRALLNGKHFHVAALVRDPTSAKAQALEALGVQLIRGNMGDKESLVQAFTGAYGVFSVQTPWTASMKCETTREIQEGRNVAQAAKEAGVRHLVYTSAIGAGGAKPSELPHVNSKTAIQNEIKALGIPHTFLHPVTFMDNWTGGVPAMTMKPGKVPGVSFPDTPLYLVAGEDIGRFAALAFEKPEIYLGKTVEIAGDVVTGKEIAGIMEKLCGYPFEYSTPPVWLLKIMAPEFAAMIELFETSPFTVDINHCRRLVPGLKTAEEFLMDMDPALLASLKQRPSSCACKCAVM